MFVCLEFHEDLLRALVELLLADPIFVCPFTPILTDFADEAS